MLTARFLQLKGALLFDCPGFGQEFTIKLIFNCFARNGIVSTLLYIQYSTLKNIYTNNERLFDSNPEPTFSSLSFRFLAREELSGWSGNHDIRRKQ